MKPLPTIPTVSSPMFPDEFFRPGTPSSTEPDLSWGTSAASNSMPGSPTSPAHPSFPTSPGSPFSEVDTAEILRIYDELRPSSPVEEYGLRTSPSTSAITEDSERGSFTPRQLRKPTLGPTPRTMARNHPYIPWSASAREHVLPPLPSNSWASPAASADVPSRPPSRSGAMAPEPEEDFMQPGCWSKTSNTHRWGVLAGTMKKKVTRRLRFGHKRPPSLHRLDTSFGIDDSPLQPRGYVLRPPGPVPPQYRGTRAPFRTPPTPSPHALAPPSPIDSIVAESPAAPSFSSSGTASLEAWLESRRRMSRELSVRTCEHLSVDEYERRGSWIHAGLEGCILEDDDEGAEERQRRAEAMHQGWACGFAGCTTHPRGQPPPLPPKPSRRRHAMELKRSISDQPTEVTCGH
jgi:hypothetical protein